MRRLLITISLLFMISGISAGAGPKISENGNKHNFSSSNTTVNYRAIDDGDPRSKQICVFCHTPHRSSGEGPLWNRRATAVSFFKRYSSPTLAIDDAGVKGVSEYGQPNGSSRLCLSCHDGVTALGAVFTTPGSISPVDIPFNKNTIGYETYSSHHPVSFKYNQAVRNLLRASPYNKELNADPPTTYDFHVKLDKQERMQCTTCHDPHQDKSAVPGSTTPFWTGTDYDTVCMSCHKFYSPAYPWNP
jgi:predicted CXXCH cytochrome family protein